MPSCFLTIILFIMTKLTQSDSLTFNFSSFKPNCRCLNYQGNASVSGNIIHLTEENPGKASAGRAMYCKQFYLWNKSSGNLSDFHTSFSFAIDSQTLENYGDGLAFFLSPGHFPVADTGGGGLGLARENKTSAYPFVAVEFDTFSNGWDPPYQHVGVDINSVKSNATSAWLSQVTSGFKVQASIRYDSSLKSLSVTFTGFSNDMEIEQNLSFPIDLRDYLPEWVSIGFSASTGSSFEKHRLYSWSFTSSLQVFDRPRTHIAPSPNDKEPKINIPPDHQGNRSNRSNKEVGLVVGITVGVFVLLGMVSTGLLYRFLSNKGINEHENNDVRFDLAMDNDLQKGTGPRKFAYTDLVRATNNFSEQEKLGQGGFGAVYRGFLKEIDSYIAVKRISEGSKQGIREYASEVKIISRLRHRNLVQLFGWCHERGELLLVYELMPYGSLDSHLYEKNKFLTWEVRYRIAQGVAAGLLYLQEEWEQLVVHRDIKSSNIMLDSNFNAKLGDFGLARLVDHGKASQTTILAGTIGYLAPECVITGKASKESDIYSFGIVALEIACGRKPINVKVAEDQRCMVQWVWDLYGGGKILEAADPRLNGGFDEKQLERLIMVGLWCAHSDAKSRPSIRKVIQVLDSETALPDLPPEIPVPSYFPPAGNITSLTWFPGNANSERS